VEKVKKLEKEAETPLWFTRVLKRFIFLKDEIKLITYPDDMSENEASEYNFKPIVSI